MKYPAVAISVGLALWLSAIGWATPQPLTVTALGQGLEEDPEPLTSTSLILYSRADFTESRHVKVGMELQPGDLLTSATENLFLELSCPPSSPLQFTGAFQVLINFPSGGLECAVDLRAGGLDVLTDGGTEVRAGEVSLGTQGTRYAVRLSEDGEGLAKVVVFEGEVKVEERGRTERLKTGQVLDFRSGDPKLREQPVSAEEIDHWANLYSRFDVIKAKAAGVKNPDIANLTRLHRQVLRFPDDRRARDELAKTLLSYRLEDAAYYHQRRLLGSASGATDEALIPSFEKDEVDPGTEGSDEDPYLVQRKQMVEEQIRQRMIDQSSLLDAMEEVPRHLFVAEASRPFAYADSPVESARGQTMVQPYLAALMISLLDLEGNEKVLGVGTGGGYEAAILSRMAQHVYSIEADWNLFAKLIGRRSSQVLASLGYSNVEVQVRDGDLGWSEDAPFDAILVTTVLPEVPESLLEQLDVGGTMVVPVGGQIQDLLVITKSFFFGIEQREVGLVGLRAFTGGDEEESRRD